MRLLLLLLLCTISLARGEEILLVHISNDYKKNRTHDLFLEVNDRGLITGIKTRSSRKNKVKRYPTKIINKPIHMAKFMGSSLVTLRCLNFNTVKGCDIEIEYPTNIAMGKFDKFKAKLKKENGKWGFYGDNGYFNKMYLRSKHFWDFQLELKRWNS